MTPHPDDFNGSLTPYDSVVENANGGIVRVTHGGSVRILMCDTFCPDHTIVVKLHDVLHIPELTKRLLSVHEWNSCNGQIYRMTDRQRVELYDNDKEVCEVVDLPPCPEPTEGVSQLHAVRERGEKRARTEKLTKVNQSLLHRRLGHVAISSLLMADKDVLWADVKMIPDRDEFCETCEITLSRKANRGKIPLEDLGKVIPGQMVMIDIIHNPATCSLTRDTYHKYYLGIIDVASRYFVPIGMTDKTPRTVFTALKKWVRLHGPTAGYKMSDIEQIHVDFDATFRSQEVVALTTKEGVRITYAAPRHQEQNGICEANWRDVRNMAFAYMNNAHVDMSFFPLALERAWKVYATLPKSALTTETGESQSPYLVYFNRPASIVNFKVLFCPVIMNYDNIFVRNPLYDGEPRKKPRLDALKRKNNSQRGIRGIHVGLSQDSKTFMVYSPSAGRVYHYENKFSGYLKLQVTDAEPDRDLPFEQVGVYPNQPTFPPPTACSSTNKTTTEC
jgi:hypothetical protein